MYPDPDPAVPKTNEPDGSGFGSATLENILILILFRRMDYPGFQIWDHKFLCLPDPDS
jgi:hypothetical protein